MKYLTPLAATLLSMNVATALHAAEASSYSSVQSEGTRPNIIMIFTDDLHYGALGVTGSVNTEAKTPNIDKIFNEGVIFPQGYATHAVSAPSRAGLMTGRYQARFDFETLPGSTEERMEARYGVSLDEVMMSDLLQDAGYKTHAIGKWHLGANPEFQPHNRGFDQWFGYRGSCGFYQFRSENRAINLGQPLPPLDLTEKPNLDIVRNDESVHVRGYLTEAFAQEAREIILREKEDPFFIYYAPYNAHAPDIVPAHYIPEGGTKHDGVIAALDVSVGVILDALDEAGVADNTLVVFSNDNGGKREYSTTFNGGKATYYEGGVRVPFGMRWPNQIEAGSTFNGMVSTLDMLPTFAAAAGAEIPTGVELDGKDLLPFVKGEQAEGELRGVHFWRNTANRAVRDGDWKLVWVIDRGAHKAKLQELGIEHFKGRKPIHAERDDALFGEPQLYNLAEDPQESNDLARQYPELTERMVQIFKEWEATIPNWRDAEIAEITAADD
ncbi:sulfatase-like hydrolase/transferase [Ferrimonas pelagia]|uniref:Sulfatase N-terminal domain-containing protein n=1 Tax=Ferrimonas pelagia TaxID=1177826 RepID=A0ABP9F3N1_9GAMM